VHCAIGSSGVPRPSMGDYVTRPGATRGAGGARGASVRYPQIFGAMGYSRNLALERKVRDARMFPIAGGTAQILRPQVAGSILGMRTPQSRDGYFKARAGD